MKAARLFVVEKALVAIGLASVATVTLAIDARPVRADIPQMSPEEWERMRQAQPKPSPWPEDLPAPAPKSTGCSRADALPLEKGTALVVMLAAVATLAMRRRSSDASRDQSRVKPASSTERAATIS